MKYFVLVQNPSNLARFALLDGGESLMMFATIKAARTAARKAMFGSHGYFEIFDVRSLELIDPDSQSDRSAE